MSGNYVLYDGKDIIIRKCSDLTVLLKDYLFNYKIKEDLFISNPDVAAFIEDMPFTEKCFRKTVFATVKNGKYFSLNMSDISFLTSHLITNESFLNNL